jgi:hypothetical protein
VVHLLAKQLTITLDSRSDLPWVVANGNSLVFEWIPNLTLSGYPLAPAKR